MRRLLTLLLMIAGLMPIVAAETAFSYPQIPDSITDFRDRTDFFVAHFWDRANLDRGISSRQKFAGAFDDYLMAIPQASADTVYASVAQMMTALEKKPDDQYFVGLLAEEKLYSDSAIYQSDELYRAFLKPVLRNKRIKNDLKGRQTLHFTQLSNSLTGYPMAPVIATGKEGNPMSFTAPDSVITLVFFNDPDCHDCRMAKVQLAADYHVRDLIDSGALVIAAFSVCEPDEAWKEYAEGFPGNWIVGAAPDLDMKFDLRKGLPAFYIIDPEGRLAAKNLNLQSVIGVLSQL